MTLLARLLPLLVLAACGGKDGADTGTDDTATTSHEVDSSFTAVVDGVDWASAPESAFWTSSHEGLLSISGAPADVTSAININIDGYTGPGSYALTADGMTWAQYVGGQMSTEPGAWVATTGTVVIESDNGTAITGTVEFDGTDQYAGTTKEIRLGAFALNPQ